MSDDKYVKEIDTIEEEDMIPNPPQVNGKLKYYMIVFAILLVIISVLSVVFDTEHEKTDTKSSSAVETRYII